MMNPTLSRPTTAAAPVPPSVEAMYLASWRLWQALAREDEAMRTMFTAAEHAKMQAELRTSPVKPDETMEQLQRRLAAVTTKDQMPWTVRNKHSWPTPRVVREVVRAAGQEVTP